MLDRVPGAGSEFSSRCASFGPLDTGSPTKVTHLNCLGYTSSIENFADDFGQSVLGEWYAAIPARIDGRPQQNSSRMHFKARGGDVSLYQCKSQARQERVVWHPFSIA